MALPNPFRGGQPGAWISGAVHGAVLLALLVGFSSEKLPDAEEGIPVEMITENQLSEMTKGEKAAAKPQPNAKPRADRVAETRVEKDPGEAKRDAPSPPKRPQEAKLADEEQEAPPPAPPVRVAEAKPEPVPAPPARPEPDRAAEARAAAEAKAAAAEAKAAADAKAAAAAEARAAAQAKAAAKAAAEARAEAEAEKLAEKQEAEALEKARVAAAKLKQEAEARAKAEAETRAKALAKAKADADAKAEAKAELDAKLKTLADADAKAAAQAERQKLAEAKALADAKAAADAKAQADAKAHADAKAKALAQAKAKADADAKARKQAELADRFSPGDISKLLASKEPSQSTGATARDVQRTASLGTATGASQRLNPSQRDQLIGLLQDQLHGCWQVPIAAQTADKPPVPSIRLKLNPDGTLAAEPAVMNTSGDPLFRAVADSATRAARRCAPLRIPAQFAPFYNDWRDLVVNFDPRAMG